MNEIDPDREYDDRCPWCGYYVCRCDYLDYEYEAAAHPWNVARPDYR